MAASTAVEALRQTALRHLWMHNRDWVRMAEEGDPTIITNASGVRVMDDEGNSWIDVNGGYNCVNVGYGRTEIAEAAYEQAKRLPYFPNASTSEPTIRLAAKVAELAPGSLDRVFPTSGGSEANETALKIARAYWRRRGEPGRFRIISRRGSYHGMTGGVMWLGGYQPTERDEFGPEHPGMVHAPQPNPYRCERGGTTPSECAIRCAEAVEQLIAFYGANTIAAVIAEPVSQLSGAAVPGEEYWPMLRDICDRHDILLIADEVITGFGRTGKWFGVQNWDVEPDIMTVAKGISSAYMPMAAAIVRREVADYLASGDDHLRHILTFSGHPVSSAAALKNIEIIENENMVENAAEVGGYIKEQLEGLMMDHPIVGDVRGIGMLNAVEFVADRDTKQLFPPEARLGDRLLEKFKKHGLILRPRKDVITVGPPLCMTRDEADEMMHAIDLALWETEGELGISRMV